MIVKGDLNGDGRITVEDLMIYSLYINGEIELTETQMLAADIDGNGIVDIGRTLNDNNDLKLLVEHLQGNLIIDEVIV